MSGQGKGMGFLTFALGRREQRRFDIALFALPRVAGIVAAILVAIALERRPGGHDLAPAAIAFALAGISVLASWALAVGAIGIGSAAALALPLERWIPGDLGATLRQLVLQLNRQLGHIESLFTWVVLALLYPRLPWQAGAAATLLVFGPVLVDYLGWRRVRHQENVTRVDVGWSRRAFFHWFTLLGLFMFFVLAPGQFGRIALLLVLAAAGAITRWAGFRWFASASDAQQRRATENGRRLDRAVLVLSAGLAIVPFGFKYGASSGTSDGAWRACAWTHCAAPPSKADLALFIVSDTQLHALDGSPSGFQVGLVDSVVPVAIRPVELDMLSGATLRHFAAIYARMRSERPEMRWAHLGDMADVGCVSEVRAFAQHAALFGVDQLAAVAPGNHDVTFLGNVFWHPQWKDACKSGRADRRFTLRQLQDLAGSGTARVTSDGMGFAATLATLGSVGEAGRTEEVVGAFLDTTDYGMFSLGIAGVQGSISGKQKRWVLEQLRKQPSAMVVVFMHHPVSELSGAGADAIAEIRRELGNRLLLIVSAHTHVAAWRGAAGDGNGNPAAKVGPTWVAPEFVVGSTLDPPQEAALLEIGHAEGGIWANVRTIAAVERGGPGVPGSTGSFALAGSRTGRLVCASDPGAVTDASCRKIIATLRDANRRPACTGLFWDDHGAAFRSALRARAPCSSCLALPLDSEQPRDAPSPGGGQNASCAMGSRLSGALDRAFYLLGDLSVQLQCSRQRRAWELLRCLLDDAQGKVTPVLPLDVPDVALRIAKLYPEGSALDPAALERRDTLVCLGWAASILQQRKREGWTYDRAIDLGFEGSATYGELSATTSQPARADDGVPSCGR